MECETSFRSQEKASRIQWTEGAIFSLPLDLGFFLLPLVFPILIYFNNLQHKPHTDLFLIFMSIKLLIDTTHLTSTLYAAVHKAQTGQLSRVFVYSSPVLILVLGSVLAKIDSRLFFTLIVYWSLIHFASQQYGFVMMSRSKAKEAKSTRWIDAVMIFNLVQYPIVYLHGSALQANRFMGGEFVFHASLSLTNLSASIFWAINLLYGAHLLLSFASRQPFNVGKFLILVNTGLVYYGCLVVMKDFWLWAICLGLTHGLPYIGITYQSTFRGKFAHHKFHKDALGRILFASNLLFLPIVVGLAVYIQRGPDTKSLLPFAVGNLLFPLYTFPMLMHYYLDSFIWKNPKKKTAPSLLNKFCRVSRDRI